MSYRKAWAKTFVTDEFKITASSPGHPTPFPCPEHAPYCLRVDGTFPSQWGWWGLVEPIDIPTVMPGTKKKLLETTLDTMVKWGGAVSTEEIFKVLVDGATILDRVPYNKPDDFGTQRYTLNRDVETAKKLTFELFQAAVIFLPGSWVNKHAAKISVSGEYYVETPPATATVNVKVVDRTTEKGIWRAYVTIMSGPVVVAEGYTDLAGNISFPNIDEGAYILKASASGYHTFEQAIDVIPPAVSYTVKLAKVPSFIPIEWLIIGGVALVGVGYVAIRRKKPEVIVVK